MDPFHFAIYAGAVISAIMVVGGLLLLLRGAITLHSMGGETSIEFSGLSFTTSTPTVALFAIGVLFLGLSIWFARPVLPTVVPVQVQTTIASDGPEPTVYAAVPLSPMVPQAEENEGRTIYKIDRLLYHRQDPEGESVTLIAFLPDGKYTMREGYVRKNPVGNSSYPRSVMVEEFRLPSARTAPSSSSTIVPAPPLPSLDDSRLEGGY